LLQLIDIHSLLLPLQPSTNIAPSKVMSSTTAVKNEDRQQDATIVNIETTQQDAIGTSSMLVFYQE
jgi:hypothetical protein